jgi:hypothetical protein
MEDFDDESWGMDAFMAGLLGFFGGGLGWMDVY